MIKPDEIIRTKRKSIALIIEPDGRLIVRAPIRAKEEKINEFIQHKAKWIVRKQGHVKSYYPPFVPKEYVNGEGFWYLGNIYKLQLVNDKKPLLYLNGNFQLACTAVDKAPIIFERWYKTQAKKVISERVKWYAAKHGYSYQQIKITSARTRWGSCSEHGTLSFSWRLVMAPMPVIDYVVVHELVHMQVKNHSKKFWAKVAVIMPDYQQKIEWLEKHGHLLSLK
jgi:predicted metal-dependent hydrolase